VPCAAGVLTWGVEHVIAHVSTHVRFFSAAETDAMRAGHVDGKHLAVITHERLRELGVGKLYLRDLILAEVARICRRPRGDSEVWRGQLAEQALSEAAQSVLQNDMAAHEKLKPRT